MSNADTQVLPGWNRADTIFLAECLEGHRGEGRRSEVETTSKAAQFIRAALAATEPAQSPQLISAVLTPSEHAEILKQRARAERNRGDEDEG